MQEKIPRKTHRETQSLWVAAKESWDQRKFQFHLAVGKMFLPITRKNLYIITAVIFALCQTKHLLTESKAAKGLFVQKPHKNCEVKKSSKWSNKSSQIENALVWFRNWFCLCWNEHSVVTPQFPPLFWWEKLTCSGLERPHCHKSAWCFKCLLEIWATQFILFRSVLQT